MPEPRSSFAAALSTDTQFFIFGGSGDNNVKYNDLWEFDGTQWIQHSKSHGEEASSDNAPLQKSGHQITIYKNRYILVFGGIHEVTYEMNDFKLFDIEKKQWRTIDEENKNASESGSPKNKGMIQQQESHKKNMFTIKNQTLDTSL